MSEIISKDYIVFAGEAYKVKSTTEKAIMLIVNRGDHVARYVNVWLPRKAFTITNINTCYDGSREVFCKDLPSWASKKIKGY